MIATVRHMLHYRIPSVVKASRNDQVEKILRGLSHVKRGNLVTGILRSDGEQMGGSFGVLC